MNGDQDIGKPAKLLSVVHRQKTWTIAQQPVTKMTKYRKVRANKK